MSWLSTWALKILGLTPQVWNFLTQYVLPFVRNNWSTIVTLLPVVNTFIRAVSAKDLTGQEKQDKVVALLREELVKKGVISSEDEASTSLLQLIVLVAYRFVSHKDPIKDPVAE